MIASDGAQLTPREIILEIGRNMYASCVPLISRIIVPSLYEVFLHQDDFHAYEPMFRLLQEEAAVHLTGEMERLNSSPSRIPAFLKQILGSGSLNLPYHRDGSNWTILFSIDPNGEMPRGSVMVSSRLQFPDSISGAKTRRVLTERFSDDSRIITDGPSMGSAVPTGGSAENRPAFAYLNYRGANGETLRFAMERPQVSIGRGGDHTWVDLQVSSARSISKEHLLIRFNGDENRFEAQDVSTNGTRMDGKLLPPKVWTPIGSSATFELAKGLSIEFKAAR